MVRTPIYDKNGLKKGTWTPDEDKKLMAYVATYGCWNWRQLPKHAGLSRCGKSCRLRWINYLCPSVKRGNFSKEEDNLILNLHHSLGNRWSAIATHLPGRTDNEIKNRWHSSLKNSSTTFKSKSIIANAIKRETICKKENTYDSFDIDSMLDRTTNNIHESTPILVPPQLTSFTQSSLPNTTSSNKSSKSNFAEDEAFSGKLFLESVDDFWTKPFLEDFDDNNNFTTDDFLKPLLQLGILYPPCPIDDGECSWFSGIGMQL